MKETKKFLTAAEKIRKRFSGWSGVKCDFCKKKLQGPNSRTAGGFMARRYAEIVKA